MTSEPTPKSYPIRLPRQFIEEGWRFLTSRERAILPVLLMHLPNIRPGRDRIGEFAGLKRSAVSNGITELLRAGILVERKQRRRPKGGDFAPNEYRLADLHGSALGVVLGKLRARKASTGPSHRDHERGRGENENAGHRDRKRGHGESVEGGNRDREHGHHGDRKRGRTVTTNADAPRPQRRAQSHHQVKPNQVKSCQRVNGQQTAIPTDTGDPRTAPESGSSGVHDDDQRLRESELRIKLPDSADRDQMKAALLNAGEDPGRAHKHAHDPLVEPGMIRGAVALLASATARNPGAYLGTLMDDLITKAQETEKQRQQQAFEATQFRRREADTRIDAMTDAELQEVIDSVGFIKGMDAGELRNAPVLRKHLAEAMAARSKGESCDWEAD